LAHLRRCAFFVNLRVFSFKIWSIIAGGRTERGREFAPLRTRKTPVRRFCTGPPKSDLFWIYVRRTSASARTRFLGRVHTI